MTTPTTTAAAGPTPSSPEYILSKRALWITAVVAIVAAALGVVTPIMTGGIASDGDNGEMLSVRLGFMCPLAVVVVAAMYVCIRQAHGRLIAQGHSLLIVAAYAFRGLGSIGMSAAAVLVTTTDWTSNPALLFGLWAAYPVLGVLCGGLCAEWLNARPGYYQGDQAMWRFPTPLLVVTGIATIAGTVFISEWEAAEAPVGWVLAVTFAVAMLVTEVGQPSPTRATEETARPSPLVDLSPRELRNRKIAAILFVTVVPIVLVALTFIS